MQERSDKLQWMNWTFWNTFLVNCMISRPLNVKWRSRDICNSQSSCNGHVVHAPPIMGLCYSHVTSLSYFDAPMWILLIDLHAHLHKICILGDSGNSSSWRTRSTRRSSVSSRSRSDYVSNGSWSGRSGDGGAWSGGRRATVPIPEVLNRIRIRQDWCRDIRSIPPIAHLRRRSLLTTTNLQFLWSRG